MSLYTLGMLYGAVTLAMLTLLARENNRKVKFVLIAGIMIEALVAMALVVTEVAETMEKTCGNENVQKVPGSSWDKKRPSTLV